MWQRRRVGSNSAKNEPGIFAGNSSRRHLALFFLLWFDDLTFFVLFKLLRTLEMPQSRSQSIPESRPETKESPAKKVSANSLAGVVPAKNGRRSESYSRRSESKLRRRPALTSRVKAREVRFARRAANRFAQKALRHADGMAARRARDDFRRHRFSPGSGAYDSRCGKDAADEVSQHSGAQELGLHDNRTNSGEFGYKQQRMSIMVKDGGAEGGAAALIVTASTSCRASLDRSTSVSQSKSGETRSTPAETWNEMVATVVRINAGRLACERDRNGRCSG